MQAVGPIPSPLNAPRWPARIAILHDYVRIPYANGSSFASQFLYREFKARGHEVTIVGPHDPEAKATELPEHHLCLPALPLRNHPGVRLPLPSPTALAEAAKRRFDITLGQTATELTSLGIWLRLMHDVPALCVNTIHLPSTYNVMLPDKLLNFGPVSGLFERDLIPWLERHSAKVYNESDGLIVLASGLRDYWRQRGVTVPIHVMPRCIEPKIFDRPDDQDPFPMQAKRGKRLLLVCRHTREKNVVRLLELFARSIAPGCPEATLTLVGDGPDHDTFKQHALELGVADKTFFPGEFPLQTMTNWYRNADVFVYPSLSETYGQVVTEALWCGLPVGAFADGRGVAEQVAHGVDGFLVEPGPNREIADVQFAKETLALLNNSDRRHRFSQAASANARLRAAPERSIERYYDVFDLARRHCEDTRSERKRTAADSLRTCLRWSWVHAATAGLGCIRPPAIINRHGRRPPTWEAELDSQVPRDGKRPPRSQPVPVRNVSRVAERLLA